MTSRMAWSAANSVYPIYRERASMTPGGSAYELQLSKIILSFGLFVGACLTLHRRLCGCFLSTLFCYSRAVLVTQTCPPKVDEINTILTNDITPTLDRLRGEKTHYLKWAANDAEEQRLQKFCVAHSFTQAEAKLNSSDGERQELEEEQAALQGALKEASVRVVHQAGLDDLAKTWAIGDFFDSTLFERDGALVGLYIYPLIMWKRSERSAGKGTSLTRRRLTYSGIFT